MTIVALRTGRDAHPLHPVLTAVTGTERAVAAALLATAPGATVVDSLPGRRVPDTAESTGRSAGQPRDDHATARARAAVLADQLDALDALAAVPFPDAGGVARALDDLLVARTRVAANRRPSPRTAQTRVEHAEAHLRHVELATQRRSAALRDGGGLEELHRLLVGLQQRAAGPLVRRSFKRRVATLQEEERILLGRIGFRSYSDYRAAMSEPDAAPGAIDRATRALARARLELDEQDRAVVRDVEVPLAEAAARLVAALEAAGPVPRSGAMPADSARLDAPTDGDASTVPSHLDAGIDLDLDLDADLDAAIPTADDLQLEHHTRVWLAGLTRAEVRRRQVDARRREVQAELVLVQAALAEVDAIAEAEARLHPAPVQADAVDVELAVLAALAAHRRRGGGPFIIDGALDELAVDGRSQALELLGSLRGEPQVVVLTDRADVVAWADTAHPGRASALRLDGRVPTRLELAADTVIDLDALAVGSAVVDAPAATPARPETSTETEADTASEAALETTPDTAPDTAFDAAFVEVLREAEAAATPDRAAAPVAAGRPERRELTADEVDRYGLDLFHLAVDEDLPMRRRG